MNIDFSILDKLIKNDETFAIYRLPASEEIHLIIQNDNQVFKTNQYEKLNNQSGFVIAPFQISEKYPIVIIRPDIYLRNSDEIEAFSKKYDKNISQKGKSETSEVSTLKNEYGSTFDSFQKELNENNFQKLVLSRKQVLPKPKAIHFEQLFNKALTSYPNSFVYLTHTEETGTWFGSTPELLLSEKNQEYATVALAGTKVIDKNNTFSENLWDNKNRKEQQFVADYMRNQFERLNVSYTETETSTFRVGNLAHLRTNFKFTKGESTQLSDILKTIHPTPAVCGLPKEKAFQFINQTEKHDRKYYAGFIGNLSMENQTDLFVNLRCMQIKEDSVVLYAGGGILTSSQKEDEWLETEAKMQTMLGILR